MGCQWEWAVSDRSSIERRELCQVRMGGGHGCSVNSTMISRIFIESFS